LAAQEPHSVTLAAGTVLKGSFERCASSSKKNHPGDPFLATLDEPLIIDEFIIADRRRARSKGALPRPIIPSTQKDRRI